VRLIDGDTPGQQEADEMVRGSLLFILPHLAAHHKPRAMSRGAMGSDAVIARAATRASPVSDLPYRRRKGSHKSGEQQWIIIAASKLYRPAASFSGGIGHLHAKYRRSRGRLVLETTMKGETRPRVANWDEDLSRADQKARTGWLRQHGAMGYTREPFG